MLAYAFLEHGLEGGQRPFLFRGRSWWEDDGEGYSVEVHVQVLERPSLGNSVIEEQLVGVVDEITCLLDNNLRTMGGGGGGGGESTVYQWN